MDSIHYTPRKICITPPKTVLVKLKGKVPSVTSDVLDTGQVRC